MKLFPFVVFIVLVFTLTVPEDSEGKKPPPWLKEAMKILGKGIKKVTTLVVKSSTHQPT